MCKKAEESGDSETQKRKDMNKNKRVMKIRNAEARLGLAGGGGERRKETKEVAGSVIAIKM